jgi:ketosteroid isomerase-like protein
MTVEDNKQNDEAAIQRLLDDGIRSVRSKNIEGVMSLCAPEVVSFDIVPKLAISGSRCIQETLGRAILRLPGPD